MITEKKIQYFALIIFILTAYFSIGHHQSDEYFQVIEFAQYKLGNISSNELPWEFHEKMRPSIQPWLTYIAIKSFTYLGITNPFTIAMFLRIITALAFCFVISKLNKILSQKYFPDKKWSILFYATSYLLWFIPYISVRFSSENYSALFFLMGIYFFLKDSSKGKNLILMGILFAFAILFRYQIALSVMGAYLWMLIIAKIPLSKLISSVLAFSLIIVFGIYLDYLFYNEFVLTALNYLKLNLIEGRAARYGRYSWWFYIVQPLLVIVPPISIILISSFFYGIKKLKSNLFVWAIIPFLLIHLLISHKEIRFLFPIVYLFIFISIYGLQAYFKKREIKRIHRRLFRFSIGLNILLLLFMTFKPADEMVLYYQYLYKNIDKGERRIVCVGKENYRLLAGLKSTFYRPPNTISDVIYSEKILNSYLNNRDVTSCYFISDKYDYEGSVEGYTIEKVYCVYPEWLKSIKGIDWQEILSTRSIYLITKSN